MSPPDPFNATVLSFGKFNPNRTTDVEIVYSHQTFLTPWPYLVADMTLSLMLTAWAFISQYRVLTKLHRIYIPTQSELTAWKKLGALGWVWQWKKDSSDGHHSDVVQLKGFIPPTETGDLPELPRTAMASKAFDIVSVIVATIRAITLCVSAVRATQDHGGRFTACTAIFMAWMSMVTFVDDYDKRWYLSQLMAMNCFIVIAVMQLMIWPKFKGTAKSYYGKLLLEGGNCAIPVKKCPLAFPVVGCGLDNPAPYQKWTGVYWYDFNKDLLVNYVANIEPFLGLILSLSGLFLLASVYYFIKRIFHARRNRDLIRTTTSTQDWASQIRHHYVTVYVRQTSAVSRTTAILAFGSIAIIMHYFQQAKPASIWVVDGRGPLVEKHLAVESWADCFEIPIVRDSAGFFGAWWRLNLPHPANWLSVT